VGLAITMTSTDEMVIQQEDGRQSFKYFLTVCPRPPFLIAVQCVELSWRVEVEGENKMGWCRNLDQYGVDRSIPAVR
jgi:hypothetical protein